MSTILIVDDEATIRQMVAEVLSMEGWTTQTARNGQEALQCVIENMPAAVLLDMNMPVLDGYGFAWELQKLGLTVPIIVMTAGANVRHCAAEINAQAYVGKPFDLDHLIDTVAQVAHRY